MKHYKLVFIILAALLALNACKHNNPTTDEPNTGNGNTNTGGNTDNSNNSGNNDDINGGDNTNNNTGNNPGTGGNDTTSPAIQAVRVGPMSAVYLIAKESEVINYCVGGVLQASRQLSMLTTSGTMTQSPGNASQFVYDSEPNDRLRTVLADGSQTDCFISNINGNFSGGIQAFINGGHQLDFQANTRDGSRINVASSKTIDLLKGYQTVYLTGTLMADGVEYTVDATKISNTYFDSSGGGLHNQIADKLTGSISSANASVTLDESTEFEFVLSKNESASTSSRNINTEWTVNGEHYALSQGRISRAFTNGSPSQYNAWSAQGTLSHNGTQIGQLTMKLEGQNILVILQAGSQQIELEKHKLL